MRELVISAERDRGLELDPRFGQAVLYPAECPHRDERPRVVRIVLLGFEQQLFGARAVFSQGFRRSLPKITYQISDQCLCDADPRIDRARVDLQRAFKST